MVHRIGVIGLGVMGQRMLGNLQGHAGFAVAAAWDAAPHGDGMAAPDPSGYRPCASAAELAAGADLVAVYIASPPVSHPDYVNLAWDHGKAVFCEKPLSVSIAASQALVGRCEAEQRRAAINFPLASAPAMRQMTEALASGVLGALQSIEIDVAFAAWPRNWQKAGDWLAQREEGGFVREVVSHFIFIAQRLAGPLTLLETRPTYPADGRAAETAIAARLGAGASCIAARQRRHDRHRGPQQLHPRRQQGRLAALRLVQAPAPRRHGWLESISAPGIRHAPTAMQLDALAAMLEGRPRSAEPRRRARRPDLHRGAAAGTLSRRAGCRASSSWRRFAMRSAMKRRSAVSSPTIASLPALHEWQCRARGAPDRRDESMKSGGDHCDASRQDRPAGSCRSKSRLTGSGTMEANRDEDPALLTASDAARRSPRAASARSRWSRRASPASPRTRPRSAPSNISMPIMRWPRHAPATGRRAS